MLFSSQVTATIEIDGHGAFVIRKLNRKRFAQAAEATMLQGIDYLKKIGGAAVIKELQASGGEAAVREQVEKDPFLRYDRSTLIRLGVIGWPTGETPTDADIEDIDEEVEETLARAVYDLSRPKTAAERKNA